MRLAVLLVAALANVAVADSALDKPSFTATPAELIAAAKAAPRGTNGGDIVTLRDDYDMSWDDQGRLTDRERHVFLVLTNDGASGWDRVGATWLPTFQDRPKFRVRVIDPQGHASELDPKQLVEAAAADDGLPDDRRRIGGPIPRLQVGSIVEEEAVITDRVAMFGGGRGKGTGFGDTYAFTASSRITFSAPAKLKLHLLAASLPAGIKPKVQTANGRQTWAYTFGPLEITDEVESYLPGDIRLPHIEASPAKSWGSVARAMRDIVDKQIAAGPVSLPADLPAGQNLDTARAIVAWVHKQVRTTWIDFNDSAVVPTPPAQTLQRGSGDIKDKATLIVAALRQAKIQAELAAIVSGPGLDAEPECPGLNGFDHVLVRAHIGSADVWIDPGQELLQVGRLPDYAQGRRALIFADTTTALAPTPASVSTDNVIREVRTFELPEAHYGKVTEVSWEGGVFEPGQRTWIRDSAATEVKESLAKYTKNEFAFATLDSYRTSAVDDLARPFEMTLVASDTQRAQTLRREIQVFLFASDTLDRLPDPLKSSKADDPKRKYDFQFLRPHVHEIENRLVIPVGYTMPTPAPETTKALGTMKLVTKQRVDGRTFVVTFRLDTGKARLTPAEVRDVQEAVRSAWDQPSLQISVDHSAFAALKRGKASDAIAEAQKLIKLHPREALHHDQLALIYLDAGAGDAARREARKAVALEPKAADPHALLGLVLMHDTLGRMYGFDYDRAGAKAALATAIKLSPTHHGARVDLAMLLERNAGGRRLEDGADYRGASEQWQGAYGLDGDAETGNSRTRALLWAGDYSTAEKWARSLPAGESRNMLLLAAVALGPGGPNAAIREASTLGGSNERTRLLDGAAGVLMLMRQYDAFRALKAEAGTMRGAQAQMFSKLARVDRKAKTVSVDEAMFELMQEQVDPGRPRLVPYVDKVVEEEQRASSAKSLANVPFADSMPSGVLADFMRANAKTTVEGDLKAWRVGFALPGVNGAIYLVGDRAAPSILGSNDSAQGVGRYVLRLLAKGDEATSLRLLDWVASDVANVRTGFAMNFRALWGTNLPRTKQAQELAAALLTQSTDADRAIPILARCGATTTEGQLACDLGLASVYHDKERWSDLEAHARAWATRSPKHPAVTVNRALALAHLGRFDEATKLLDDALAATPDNLYFAMTACQVAAGQGKLADAIKRLDAVVSGGKGGRLLVNNLAWLELVEGSNLTGALDTARQAVAADSKNRHSLHTLAAILAERGEVIEARKSDWESMASEGLRVPDGQDYYVHGRILEQLGLTSDAIAAYRKVTKDPSLLPESDDLAARRLRILGTSKKR